MINIIIKRAILILVINIEFCSKCGGLMMPKKSGSKIVLICRNCGAKKTTAQKKDFKVSTTAGKKDKIIIVEKKKNIEVLPKTDIDCPKCENKEAFWWMIQTRSGDEPPTRFYRCTKCNHTWREYE